MDLQVNEDLDRFHFVLKCAVYSGLCFYGAENFRWCIIDLNYVKQAGRPGSTSVFCVLHFGEETQASVDVNTSFWL